MTRFMIFLSVFLLYILYFPMEVNAATIFKSPYVSFSPDGSCWTVAEELPYSEPYQNYWEREDSPEYWYGEGTTRSTGIVSAIRELREGEHYYKWNRFGEIPVGKWVVEHAEGKCVHESADREYFGYQNVPEKCYYAYYSGWIAYCADCGEAIRPVLMYMSSKAVQTIDYVNVNFGYYYVCPTNGHLENAMRADAHKCKEISYNKYRVEYLENANGGITGQMLDSFHMYDNANIYEGMEVTPQTNLSLNTYTRTGYVFVGWNTEPDGSGTFYEDGAPILNLSVYDYSQDEVRGTVTLYAQWEKAESTLHINPNGGSYDGNGDVTSITQMYGTTYLADPEKVTAPDGYMVSFQTNGGTAVKPVKGTNHFNSWIMGQPFSGRFRDNIYAFVGADGAEDTLTAYYEPNEVELPETTRRGYSFGGWYFDEKFTQPAGGVGDTIVPNKDTVLYAQWVDLKLESEDNYTANGGKGAVDLTWSQSDNNNKSYLVYQSLDGENWTRVNSATDISNEHVIGIPFKFTGKSQTYTVPYTGLYTLEAFGAQGEGHYEKVGGLGGGVVAKVWLTKGEVLTLNIGGVDGYNGGGDGWMYGNGGGATTVVSNLRGTLLIGAGGGGATKLADGGDGGLNTSLRADKKPEGADGGAGGGAGYVGGNAGEAIVHTCTDACYKSVDKDILNEYAAYRSVYEYTYWNDDSERDQEVQEIRYGKTGQYIPVNGATTLHLEVLQDIQRAHGSKGNDPGDSYIAVYDQNDKLIYKGNGYHSGSDYFVKTSEEHEFDEDGEYISGDEWHEWGPISTWDNPLYRICYDVEDGSVLYSTNNFSTVLDANNPAQAALLFRGTTALWDGTAYFGGWGTYYYEDIPIPSGTTGIRIVSSIEYNSYWNHSYYAAKLTGARVKTCGYTNGQIISFQPAYGGSNFVNTNYINSYKTYAGTWQGNGAISIASVNIGFVDSLELEAVLAPDKAAPDKVSEDTVLIEASDETDGRVKVVWDVPKDNGTDYYHKVESYLVGSENPLCESNITKNTLTSGIQGYYYRVDYKSTGDVSKSDKYIDSPNVGASVSFDLQDKVVYVHVAAVDVAGNLGATAHIKVEDIAWNLSTEKITITDIINGTDYGTVYAKGDGSYYVRADGEGPFQLAFNSKMHGPASEKYQIDYQIFISTSTDGSNQRYITRIPYSDPLTSTSPLSVSQFTRKVNGSEILTDAMNTGAGRYNTARNNAFYQSFTIPNNLHGQTIVVTPVAGATYREDVKYSVWEKDKLNSITLIADGEAPLVSGAEILEGLTEIDRDEQDINLDLSATDDLSGVRDFKVTITNNDSLETKEYTPSADGHIRIHLTGEETIFYGDIGIQIKTTDNVGNKRTLEYGAIEFALQAKIVNARVQSTNVCRRGETALLQIVTYGYAERVEITIPEELREGNESVPLVYNYPVPNYVKEELITILVPLYAEAKEYQFTVRAYKNGRVLVEEPTLVTIGEGTVLDDIRYRVR